jgi:hypothetical protein
MGATAGLDAVEKREILCFPGVESDSPVRIQVNGVCPVMARGIKCTGSVEDVNVDVSWSVFLTGILCSPLHPPTFCTED